MGLECVIPRLDKIPLIHFDSHVAAAMDLYFASADERDTVCCFFVFQEIGELPSNTNHPVTERLVNGQPAQSESHHP
jgi:hypothetical protein